jgi:hypothetical protein
MMLRRDTRNAARIARARLARWWHRGPSRARLRRRLVVFSVPIALLLLAAIGKITSTMLTGDAAVADFARHDIDALRDDVESLSTVNVIQPGEVAFIAGDLAVLEGRLDDAEKKFDEALTRGGADGCSTRVNLELVRETQGDLAARNGDKGRAEERYTSALQVVSQAPAGCFKDNNDANPDRRKIRNDAEPRLRDKIKTLHLPPPPPAAPPQTVNPSAPPTSLVPTTLPPPPGDGATSAPAPPPPPPPPPPAPGEGPLDTGGGPGGGDGGQDVLDPVSPDRIPTSGNGSAPPHRLGTGDGGDPLEKLRKVLGDADATGSSTDSTDTGT